MSRAMAKPHLGQAKVRTEGDKPSAITCPQQEQVFVVPRSLNFLTSFMVFYYSGHGNEDASGLFQTTHGAKLGHWDWVSANDMAFGNEELR